MIDKPKQYYDTRRHQLYYQWSESEYFSHQEPIYDRTREYIESLEAENAKLRERAVAMLSELRGVVSEGDYDSPSGRYFLLRKDVAAYEDALRELGIEV